MPGFGEMNFTAGEGNHTAEVALALHLLGVVLWIGGVAMVTTIVIPSARRLATRGN
jgi:uncharacterized membrane protein